MTRGWFPVSDPVSAIVVLAAIGIFAAGCVAGSGVQSPASSTVTPAPTPAIAAVETFPPPWVVEPDLYDANHCLVPPPGEPTRECLPVSPEPAWAADPNDPGPVLGFNGPTGDAVGGYVRILRANAVVLVPETVTVSKVGRWHALGLIRNETPTNAGALRVGAILRGRDGSLLDLPSGPALIDPLRPGEPAPFELSSAVDASEVASVDWTVEVGEPDTAPRLRSFAIGVDWSVPFGDRERLTWGDEWSGWPPDPTAPPYPFTMTGMVTNYAPRPVEDTDVAVAFADADGRIVWAGPATMLPLAKPLAPIGDRSWSPGGQRYVVQVTDPDVAPLLQSVPNTRHPTATTFLWAWGR